MAETPTTPIDRRRLLIGLGVAGVAWTAPTILTVDRASGASGSAPPGCAYVLRYELRPVPCDPAQSSDCMGFVDPDSGGVGDCSTPNGWLTASPIS
jgi:hypothetical protein